MPREPIIDEIKARLTAKHGPRLRGVVIFGSEARGEARPDSDVDVLVLLAGPIDYGRDLEANIEALYPLSVRIGRRISPKPVDEAEYDKANCPLYRTAHAEGIVI